MRNFYGLVNKLKFLKRQGWLDRNLEADSIGAHVYGAMAIGWFLAEKEKADKNKVVQMLLVHDLVMAKIEDVTPASGKYQDKRELEDQAAKSILETLPEELRGEYHSLFEEFTAQKTKEAMLAREADKLETLFQGEAYEQEPGRKDILDEFLITYEPVFKTVSGIAIFKEIESRHEERKMK